MDWKDYLDDTSDALNRIRKVKPQIGEGFTALHKATMAPGALSTKDKELQALAIGISQRCTDCIGFHVRAAQRAGATREELIDTIGVAVMMGGGPAYMYGAKAIDAWDDLG